MQVEWPVEKAPTLVMFESEEPHFYKGDLTNSEEILNWLKGFIELDPAHVEEEASGDDVEGEGVEG